MRRVQRGGTVRLQSLQRQAADRARALPHRGRGRSSSSTEARCGKPSSAGGSGRRRRRRIELAIAVVPAVATKAKPDPLFLIAGGPGRVRSKLLRQILGAFAGSTAERDLRARGPARHGGSNRPRLRHAGRCTPEGGEIVPAGTARARERVPRGPARPAAVLHDEHRRAGPATPCARRSATQRSTSSAAPTAPVSRSTTVRRYPEHVRTVDPRRRRAAGARARARRSRSSRSARSIACPGALRRATRPATLHFPRSPRSSRNSTHALREGPVAVRLADPVTARNSHGRGHARATSVTVARACWSTRRGTRFFARRSS